MEASIQEIEEITYIDLEDHMENLVPQFEEIPENNETPVPKFVEQGESSKLNQVKGKAHKT